MKWHELTVIGLYGPNEEDGRFAETFNVQARTVTAAVTDAERQAARWCAEQGEDVDEGDVLIAAVIDEYGNVVA